MLMLKGNSNKKVGFRGLYQTAETDFDDFRLDFHGEFEAIFETALAHESGLWGGRDCLMKKTEGQKSHDTVPLKLKSLINDC
jgi:hypothetical protein